MREPSLYHDNTTTGIKGGLSVQVCVWEEVIVCRPSSDLRFLPAPGTRRCCDVESTSLTLIQRRNNVVCPVGFSLAAHFHWDLAWHTRAVDAMSVYCWLAVSDIGPTIFQHWVSRFLLILRKFCWSWPYIGIGLDQHLFLSGEHIYSHLRSLL